MRVEVTGVDIPFMDVVLILIKLAVAAVPASISVVVLWWAFLHVWSVIL